MNNKKFDVIIIGGGPAGSITALRLNQEGLSTVVVDRKKFPREKVCGGLLTKAASDFLDDYLDLKIDVEIFETPTELGLYFIPPTGKRNSVKVKNYSLLNVSRTKFDSWLFNKVVNSETKVITNDQVVKIKKREKDITIKTKTGMEIHGTYLVGADGVKSLVYRELIGKYQKSAPIYQETFKLTEEQSTKIEPYFYNFLNGKICGLYAYVIPKKETVILGVGEYNTQKGISQVTYSMSKFKQLLNKEFPEFKQIISAKPLSKKLWFIPFDRPMIGVKNILLAGDAAGIINYFSGEGIRLAIESGFYAAEAIIQAYSKEKIDAYEIYFRDIEQIINLCYETKKFAVSMDENKREAFVKDMRKK
ncbi:MAG: NAD(P)/FAD-dependent oxidoreductase [Candidatus Odinarchaeia archaeon]